MGAALPLPRSTKALDDDNPFPGLRYFVEDESQFFIGRDTEIKELLRRIRRDPLTVLFGVSGLGKTSLLLAGVFPILRDEGYFPVRLRVDFNSDAGPCAAQVIAQTRAAADRLGVETTEANADESMWEYFHRAEFWGGRNKLLKPALVLDQFEEVFSLGIERNDARVAPFFEELADLVENRIPVRDRRRIASTESLPYSLTKQQYRVVLSMREDYLPELEAWHRRMPSIRSNRMRLQPMNGLAALKVVTQVPDRASPEMADKIVRYVAANKDDEVPLQDLKIEPALLSVVCCELNKRRIARNLDTITEGLLQIASKQVLENLYEECLKRVPEVRDDLQKLIEEQLLTRSGKRDNVAFEDCLDEQRGITEELLLGLVEERLIRIEERSGVRRLELTHDLWTEVVLHSRDRRRRKEKSDQERQKALDAQKKIDAEKEQERQRALDAERAEAKAREEHLVASRKKLRFKFIWSGVGALVVIAVVAGISYGLAESKRQLDEALEDLKSANRNFAEVQSAVDALGVHIDYLVVVDKRLVELSRATTVDDNELAVLKVRERLNEIQDDIVENYLYLQSVARIFDKASVQAQQAAAETVAANEDPADPFALLASTNSDKRASGLAQLLRHRLNDLPTVMRAITDLSGLRPDFDDPQAIALLSFLSQTPLTLWDQSQMTRVFDLLDGNSQEDSRQVVAHVNLAAIGHPKDELRQSRRSLMVNSLRADPVQIGQALAALEGGILNPLSRYNTLYYLHESDTGIWTSQQILSGCRIGRELIADVGVGSSTKGQVRIVMDELDALGCPQP